MTDIDPLLIEGNIYRCPFCGNYGDTRSGSLLESARGPYIGMHCNACESEWDLEFKIIGIVDRTEQDEDEVSPCHPIAKENDPMKSLTFIQETESLQTGGHVMNDIVRLKDGTVVVVSDDLICVYDSEEDYDSGVDPKTSYDRDPPTVRIQVNPEDLGSSIAIYLKTFSVGTQMEMLVGMYEALLKQNANWGPFGLQYNRNAGFLSIEVDREESVSDGFWGSMLKQRPSCFRRMVQ